MESLSKQFEECLYPSFIILVHTTKFLVESCLKYNFPRNKVMVARAGQIYVFSGNQNRLNTPSKSTCRAKVEFNCIGMAHERGNAKAGPQMFWLYQLSWSPYRDTNADVSGVSWPSPECINHV